MQTNQQVSAQIKTIPSLSDVATLQNEQLVYDLDKCIHWLEQAGKFTYGDSFKVIEADKQIIFKLIAYFIGDVNTMAQFGLQPQKGIMLTGPCGVGKTSLMNLLRNFCKLDKRYIMRSCREISFEFIKEGYPVITRYSSQSITKDATRIFCFDDLGTENNLKYFGNECNAMQEILLSRYDLFISQNQITHLTTNLSASEIEKIYGNRIRSRMREMFNLVAFDKEAKDKRI